MVDISVDPDSPWWGWVWKISAGLGAAGLAIWSVTFGALHVRVRAVEKKCNECPVGMVSGRNQAILEAEERWYGKLRDSVGGIMVRLDRQDETMNTRFDELHAQILSALRGSHAGGD